MSTGKTRRAPSPSMCRRRLLLAGSALAAGAVMLGGCGVVAENATTTMPTSANAGETGGGAAMTISPPAEAASASTLMPVYWLGLNETTVSLYREFLHSDHTGDPVGEAVRAMTAGKPLDQDYFTPWHPADSVTASISSKNVITVDISSDAFKGSLDSGMAHRAVQQLVYTATAAAANAKLTAVGQESTVVILVDGKAGYRAFGHVPLDEPLRRDTKLAAPIWIIDPQESQVRGSDVEISGTAVAQPSQLYWRAEPVVDGRPSSAAVAAGTVDLHAAVGETGRFSFSATLAPGDYSIRVFYGGHESAGDSKRITVISDPGSPEG
ncbi:GerMN domain-containing protein [Arthrobacter sp. zg-Y20]|uniref:GerMN domain-containing protein n=1 Tax=unclassified Arthrobacter TaxID=235627 RepID=UPI001D15C0AF|nr:MULTISPECIES: GerMN domain-containing protein [unclassified Arthrobacter]MCC3274829.1 GerMN domain-containing protein [Arthrobacter sp. zg-Y20]MDK1314985.1 GerMN domain-containing protein [Arthrobacter sp. zg.Y20]MDK1327847.1 GerMN domain-containing protein [Arthrobacter sp. zg-Y1143]WIB04837.1 GerMN domain-containing protein [Arthrobacter sp. zg-Y20]